MSNICIIKVYIHGRNEAENMTESSGDTLRGVGSGVCELTNQRRLGILKPETEGGGIQCSFIGQYEKTEH